VTFYNFDVNISKDQLHFAISMPMLARTSYILQYRCQY